MLDSTTKRNIDAARPAVVGKVPDPKAQVEQITTALIYKFMHDMDQESVELGGEATFFTGGYDKYSWSNLMDTRLSGEGRLDLYTQAISRMSRNPNLPQLFRDIFKDAFLPYRDPQTLSLFLKEIDKFTYDHSEELGNAFEYLLSVLGSQGDAGQFRTPRHIIDFMVEVVDPQKSDTILDPACGTAGFLISAYKHIRKKNSSNYAPEKDENAEIGETAAELILAEKEVYKGDLLTPAERKKISQNIQGYDISPDMVRLSLVNMYLHGFPNPKIYEYDTLTSEKRWDETFDVILANPPFMTPKGGIRPHKRFQVQANRSEVLFVDYILEHLSINGRAGIIVPEGIIFKSDNAYKHLRRLLLDDGLYAVVSLPSGVFNPYSGVKTSILFFDKTLSYTTDEILFLSIKYDGFGLGAQRRKIKDNNLPLALKILSDWKQGKKNENKIASWVRKVKISEDGEYNLSANRYQELEIFDNDNWQLIELGDVISLEYGKPLKKSDRKEGNFPVYGSNGVIGYHDEYLVEGPFIVVGRKGSAGAVTYSPQNGYPIDTTFYVNILDDQIILKFLFYILRNLRLDKVNTQAGVPGLNRNDAYKIKIPLPPLNYQKEIVDQIEVKQGAIDGANVVIENLEQELGYFGNEIRKLENVHWSDLGEVCETSSGGTPLRKKSEYYKNGTIPWLKSGEVRKGYVKNAEEYITERALNESSAKIFPKNTILIAMYGATAGQVGLLKIKAATNQAICGVLPNDEFIPEFLYYYLSSLTKEMVRKSVGGAQPNISQRIVKRLIVPILPLTKQEELLISIKEIENIIKKNKKLEKIMVKRIDQILSDI